VATSDDLELALTLANYPGIAIENAAVTRWRASGAVRAAQFENIVRVDQRGIPAADWRTASSWNNQLERLTGISRYEAVGDGRTSFPGRSGGAVRPRGATGIHNYISSLPAAGERQRGVAGADAEPGRRRRNVGAGARSRLTIFELTEREDLERRLVQADKLSSIGLLAAGVAHEVNTPLAVISTYAQMLAKQLHGDETKSKLLDKIAKQTFRASEIVNSLLNFSRTSSTAFEEVDLNRGAATLTSSTS
jgi:signal transduction histidine kinase